MRFPSRIHAASIALAVMAAVPLFHASGRAVQGVKVPTQGDFYRLRYSDELLSENDYCPVRKIKLGERMPPVLVNGKVIGFC
jgi:hypothetical protein